MFSIVTHIFTMSIKVITLQKGLEEKQNILMDSERVTKSLTIDVCICEYTGASNHAY